MFIINFPIELQNMVLRQLSKKDIASLYMAIVGIGLKGDRNIVRAYYKSFELTVSVDTELRELAYFSILNETNGIENLIDISLQQMQEFIPPKDIKSCLLRIITQNDLEDKKFASSTKTSQKFKFISLCHQLFMVPLFTQLESLRLEAFDSNSIKGCESLFKYRLNVLPSDFGLFATNLKKLEIASHRLQSFEAASEMVNLEYLDISDNFLTDISSLQKCHKLKYLNIEDNEIRDFNILSNLKELIVLLAGNNFLFDIGFIKYLKNLQKLDLHDNVCLKKLESTEQLDALFELDISGTGLETFLEVEMFPCLEKLKTRYLVLDEQHAKVICQLDDLKELVCGARASKIIFTREQALEEKLLYLRKLYYIPVFGPSELLFIERKQKRRKFLNKIM